MPKFKEGDYVILREDARYPSDGSLWSTVDKSLKCGDLFKVKQTGEYKWSLTDKLDCVSVCGNSGWMPESCFDHANISKFEKDELVECYRLPNEYDWTITKCGEINHSLIVGGQYKVFDIADNSNIKLNGVCGWFPPTIFRKIIKVQQLPKQWCVACKNDDKDTPELLEWRNSGWVGKGFIGNDKVWQNKDDIKQIISYETFLELVYKPWKSIQPIVKNPPPSLLTPLLTSPITSSDPRIVKTPDIGAKVVRGRDWEWGNQDDNNIGTIIDKSSEGWVKVKWDNKDYRNSYRIGATYRIGANGKYDLYYYTETEPITNLSPYSKEYQLDNTTKNYLYSVSESTTTKSSSFPKLIINKTKKRLLSTEVQELNVNLNLLKTP
jgi:hypothetical protein